MIERIFKDRYFSGAGYSFESSIDKAALNRKNKYYEVRGKASFVSQQRVDISYPLYSGRQKLMIRVA